MCHNLGDERGMEVVKNYFNFVCLQGLLRMVALTWHEALILRYQYTSADLYLIFDFYDLVSLEQY